MAEVRLPDASRRGPRTGQPTKSDLRKAEKMKKDAQKKKEKEDKEERKQEKKRKDDGRKEVKKLNQGWICCQCRRVTTTKRKTNEKCSHGCDHTPKPRSGPPCPRCRDIILMTQAQEHLDEFIMPKNLETGWYHTNGGCNAWTSDASMPKQCWRCLPPQITSGYAYTRTV
jgi:hypothetical protein